MQALSPTRCVRRTLAHPLGLWWLVLALVVAPALGRMHLVLHGPGSQAPQTSGVAVPHAHGAIGDLFASHTPAECQLLDQLNHGGAATQEPPRALAAPVPACPAAPHAEAPLPRAVAAFQARAPPLA